MIGEHSESDSDYETISEREIAQIKGKIISNLSIKHPKLKKGMNLILLDSILIAVKK